jgi:hypothetical protein
VRTLWRLYSYDPLLDGLAQHLQYMAPKLRPFIQKENPVVSQRYLAGHRHLAAPDQPHLGGGIWRGRGATRARGDDGGTGAGEASNAGAGVSTRISLKNVVSALVRG